MYVEQLYIYSAARGISYKPSYLAIMSIYTRGEGFGQLFYITVYTIGEGLVKRRECAGSPDQSLMAYATSGCHLLAQVHGKYHCLMLMWALMPENLSSTRPKPVPSATETGDTLFYITLCIREVKALARRRTRSPEHSLIAYAISAKMSFTGSYNFVYTIGESVWVRRLV